MSSSAGDGFADPALQGLARKFRRANETFGGLSNQLQKSIMGIRKVPLPTDAKIPRMVRDLSQAINKEVNLEIIGEDMEVDKSSSIFWMLRLPT